MEEITRVKTLKEAWDRLKNHAGFWFLIALFGLVPILRWIGI